MENALLFNPESTYLVFDLDRDGDTDLVEIWEGAGEKTNITNWEYDGVSGFNSTSTTYGISDFSEHNSYILLDGNNDELVDLVEIWQGQDGTANATIFMGNGEGEFGTFGNFSYSWNLGDFNSEYSYLGIDYNNDGFEDIVRRSSIEGTPVWTGFISDGNGVFSQEV